MDSLLDAVYGDSKGYFSLESGPIENGVLSFRHRKFYQWPEQRDEALAHAEAQSYENVYFCSSLLDQPKRAGESATVSNVVYVDADSCDPSNFRVPPSIVVETSLNKWHCYWLLDQEYATEEITDVIHRLCVAHKTQGCDPSSRMRAKLMRLPGSHNTKYNEDDGEPFEVSVTNDTGKVYTLAELMLAYEDVDVMGSVSASDRALPEDLPNLIDVLGKVSLDVITLYRAEPEPNQDWSAMRWLLALTGFREGLSAEEVFVLVWNTKFNKYERDHRPSADLWKYEIVKAEAVVLQERSMQEGTIDSESTNFLVEFVSPEEREKYTKYRNFVDDFEAWVAARSPLASHKYSRFMAHMVLSSVYGDWIHVVPTIGKLNPNLWGLLLGPTSELKKSTVVNLGLELIREWEKRLPEDQRGVYVGSDFTAEGLNTALAARDGRVSLVHRDEIHGFFHEVFSKTYLAGGIERMTALYDGRVMKTMRATKNQSQVADATTVFNFLGLGIEDLTSRALNSTHFSSGFLPRSLWCVDDAPKWQPERELLAQVTEEESKQDDNGMLILCNQFTAAARKWNMRDTEGESVPILMSDDALARINQFSIDSKYLILGHAMEPLLEPSRIRMVWSVWKVAALYAVHDRANRIELSHLTLALIEAENWFKDLVRMAKQVASTDFETQVNDVEKFIATFKRGTHSSAVYRKFSQHRKGDVDEWLIALRSQGRINMSESGTYSIYGKEQE